MNELVKALGRFLTRNIFYILSGLYLLVAADYAWKLNLKTIMNTFDSDFVSLFFIIGTAYILGLVTKEIFAFFQITKEAHWYNPCCIDKILHKIHQQKKWEQPKEFDYELVYKNISVAGGLDVQSRYDQISHAMHAFNSIGAALVLIALILMMQCIIQTVIFILGGIGIVLILMGRVQTLRRMRFLGKYN